ncbi:response regulator transcription factor [Paraburkholderia nemoris]|uniref:response regulator transcription factor n=1 Tax=Paraburkholderia nemoris TaxID=2793076 RepID=UPI0038B8CC98
MKSKRSSAWVGIVDDDESVRMGLSSVLRSAGWHVIVYPSGDRLLGDSRRSKLRLLVADIQMPGMDGFALLEAIALWKRPVPIIFITAYATPEVCKRAETHGAAGLLAKPVSDVQLLTMIEEILEA